LKQNLNLSLYWLQGSSKQKLNKKYMKNNFVSPCNLKTAGGKLSFKTEISCTDINFTRIIVLVFYNNLCKFCFKIFLSIAYPFIYVDERNTLSFLLLWIEILSFIFVLEKLIILYEFVTQFNDFLQNEVSSSPEIKISSRNIFFLFFGFFLIFEIWTWSLK